MRGPDLFVSVAFASSLAVGACSLAVGTSGLSGGGTEAPDSEAATLDAARTPDAGADAMVTDATVPDAGFSCDGVARITTFGLFSPTSGVVLQGGTLTATGSTNAKSERLSAIGQWDVPTVPSRMFLSYDLSLTASDVVYFEPGCGVYLEDTVGETVLRHTFAANHSGFAAYLNLTAADGGTDNRITDFAELPSGETTRHVELLLAMSGANASVDLKVDGLPRSETVVFAAPPHKLVFRCGIIYGEQGEPGAATTTVTIRSLSISLCP